MLDFVAHTRKLVTICGSVNKETCVEPHKRTGNVQPMGIADNLKRLRNAAGMSQHKLAEKSGVSQQLISQIERGENTSTKYLPALASAIGCQISDIDPSYEEQSVSTVLTKVGIMSWKEAESILLTPLAHATRQTNFIKELVLSGLDGREYIGLQAPDDRLDRVAPIGALLVIDLECGAPVDDLFYVYRHKEAGTLVSGRFRAGEPDRLRPFSTNADQDTQLIGEEFAQVGRIVRVITEV